MTVRNDDNQNQNLKQKSFGYLLTVRTDNNQNQTNLIAEGLVSAGGAGATPGCW